MEKNKGDLWIRTIVVIHGNFERQDFTLVNTAKGLHSAISESFLKISDISSSVDRYVLASSDSSRDVILHRVTADGALHVDVIRS